MSDLLYRGKLVDNMTKEELIQALEAMDRLYRSQLSRKLADQLGSLQEDWLNGPVRVRSNGSAP